MTAILVTEQFRVIYLIWRSIFQDNILVKVEIMSWEKAVAYSFSLITFSDIIYAWFS